MNLSLIPFPNRKENENLVNFDLRILHDIIYFETSTNLNLFLYKVINSLLEFFSFSRLKLKNFNYFKTKKPIDHTIIPLNLSFFSIYIVFDKTIFI